VWSQKPQGITGLTELLSLPNAANDNTKQKVYIKTFNAKI